MFPNVANDNAVDVQNLTPCIKLCCKDRAPCSLCMVVDIEMEITLDEDMKTEGSSGQEEENYSKETTNHEGKN